MDLRAMLYKVTGRTGGCDHFELYLYEKERVPGQLSLFHLSQLKSTVIMALVSLVASLLPTLAVYGALAIGVFFAIHILSQLVSSRMMK